MTKVAAMPICGENLCMGKVKIIHFIETIAALGLKVAWSIQQNKFIKFSRYQRSRPFFDLGQRLLRFKS